MQIEFSYKLNKYEVSYTALQSKLILDWNAYICSSSTTFTIVTSEVLYCNRHYY